MGSDNGLFQKLVTEIRPKKTDVRGSGVAFSSARFRKLAELVIIKVRGL